MKLTHASDKGLIGFIIALNTEGWVFLSELSKSCGQSVTVSLCLWLNGNFDNWIWNIKGFKDNWALFVTHSVTSRSELETNDSNDVACASALDFFTLVSVHLQETTNALTLTSLGIVHGHARFDATRVNTAEGKVTDVWVREELEHETSKRFFFITVAGDDFFWLVSVCALHLRNINWGWQVVNNSVEQRLNAHVTESRATQYRYYCTRNGSLTYTRDDFFLRKFFTAEVLFHQSFVFFSNGFDKLKTHSVELIFVFSRHFGFEEGSALGCLVKGNSLASNKVDNAFEMVFSTDRQLKWNSLCAKAVVNHLHATLKVRADTVHLIDEADTRNAVSVSLTPNGFRLWLNASNCVEYTNGAVKNTQGTFNFNGEVNVAWGVNDVDAVLTPEAGGSSRGDSNTTFLLLFHPVHGGSAIVGFTNFMGNAGVVKNTFGSRGFARVNVGHDTDVTLHIDRY